MDLNQIICDDALHALKNIDSEVFALTFTSPPYNLKVSYGTHNDDMPYAQYIDWLSDIFAEVYRTTKDGGRLAINIDAMTNRQDDKDQEYIRPIYPHLYERMKKIGWKFRTEICWYKQNAVGKATAWGSYCSCSNPIIRRTHEYLLLWSKNQWRLDSDLKSDMTPEEFQQWTLSTWFIQPETRNLGGHPAPFPVPLAKRVIKLFSYPEDLILDPFCGVGTTPLSAKYLRRKYIGIDIDDEYCKYARQRIDNYRDLLNEIDEPINKKPENKIQDNVDLLK